MIKKLLVEFECYNGYSCSCHTQKWVETEIYEVEDEDDLETFLKELNEATEAWYHASIHTRFGRHKVLRAYVVTDIIELKTQTLDSDKQL